MIYPKDFESKIGFDVLRTILSSKCLSELGRRICAEMSMLTNRGALIGILQRVDEMKTIMSSSSPLPLDYIANPADALLRLKADGGYLSAERFSELANFIHTADRLRHFFSPDADGALARVNLTSRFSSIPDLSEPLALINDVIDKHGQVRDNASPRLSEIRRSIASAQAAVNGLMRRVIEAAVRKGILSPDVSPSLRDGHLVIPISAANKKTIPGIVFDQSATGKTYFIEPAQVVEANNNLKALHLDEQKEIIEILTSLTLAVRPWTADLEDASALVGLIDFIRAKALLAIDLDAQMPKISKQVELDWYHAVHPVLLLSLRTQGREVVPLNIQLDGKQRIVIISGPNAGGKSVCLKTIAIVQYMMQCGLLPTLYSNSHMGVFTKLLIDIGDEQSIENDLSTYSSHLRNMRVFLTKSGPDTLFLADEMGSGTEPQIGGAIAQAILKKLNQQRAFGVVTTHYQNLKTFANETEGLVNAAMLYDRQHLQPLFKLAIGTPGSSFALDIARKSGIHSDIIADAKEIAGSDYVNIDKYLLDLARDKKYWAEKRLSIKEKENQLDREAQRLHERADEIKSRRAEILHQARQEAHTILEGANAKIENAIREIRSAEAEKEHTRRIRQQLDQYRNDVLKQDRKSEADKILNVPLRKKKQPKKNANSVPLSPVELKVGDYVKMPSSSIPGKILTITGDRAELAIGALRTWQPLKNLTPVKAPQVVSKTPTITSSTYEDSRRRQLDFHNEIDVRGLRADEALQAVTYFLDDAIQFQASRVRILHGTGTGALRVAIRQMLQAHNGVLSFHDEDVRLGGAGITVVNLQ